MWVWRGGASEGRPGRGADGPGAPPPKATASAELVSPRHTPCPEPPTNSRPAAHRAVQRHGSAGFRLQVKGGGVVRRRGGESGDCQARPLGLARKGSATGRKHRRERARTHPLRHARPPGVCAGHVLCVCACARGWCVGFAHLFSRETAPRDTGKQEWGGPPSLAHLLVLTRRPRPGRPRRERRRLHALTRAPLLSSPVPLHTRARTARLPWLTSHAHTHRRTRRVAGERAAWRCLRSTCFFFQIHPHAAHAPPRRPQGHHLRPGRPGGQQHAGKSVAGEGVCALA